MKWVKYFEDFKINNINSDNINQDDIIDCIKNNGFIYSSIIKNYPDNDPKEPMRPVSIDDDGLVTVDIYGSEYSVELKNIERIE